MTALETTRLVALAALSGRRLALLLALAVPAAFADETPAEAQRQVDRALAEVRATTSKRASTQP